ncbi:MAG: hypothetical protein ACRD1C_08390 [Terriglobales bacterium]
MDGVTKVYEASRNILREEMFALTSQPMLVRAPARLLRAIGSLKAAPSSRLLHHGLLAAMPSPTDGKVLLTASS